MNLTAYCRVLTQRQEDEGLSLEAQEAAIRRWAKAHGHRIVSVHRDAVSGTRDLEGREGLSRALAEVQAGQAEGVAVWKLDRVARDLMVQEAVLRDVWRMRDGHGELFSTVPSEANLRDDPEDPGRRLMRQVFGAIADYERSTIALRLRQGRHHKRLRGGYIGGAPRYGLQAQDRELASHDAEGEVAEHIAALRAEGLSYRAISDLLNTERVPAKRGGQWHPQTVARVARWQAQAAG
ncbi:MAG: recombinase family protein [Euzebyaceae bacterium]|nr:recombinase family protein [Euzebyaceae bacterium]